MSKKPKVRELFSRRNWPNWAALLILTAMFFMAFYSMRGIQNHPGDSGIVDEIAHIPAGYTYLRDRDYRLNPEHPPLAKAIAAIPLIFNKTIVGPESDWSYRAGNQWEAGWYMLYESGNDPAAVLFWARLPMILLMIGLGLFLFKWAKELFGAKVAIFVLGLYAFYPDVLAHGRFVTTDIAAAFGFLVSIYFFEKSLRYRTWKWIIFAGLAFALAQLLKFSAVLLFFIFLVLVVVRAILDREENNGFWRSFWLNFKTYFLVCVFSLLSVWILYIPFVSGMTGSVEHQVIEQNLPGAAGKYVYLRQFFHLLEDNVITRALGHYLLGIAMVFTRVSGGNTTFILGELSDKTIRWYFPVAWLLKTSIPVILLSLYSLWRVVSNWPKKKEDRWLIFLIGTPIVVYWLVTLAGSLNIGIRHLMPTVPFVLLLIGYGIRPWFREISKHIGQVCLVIVLGVYAAISTVLNYPSFVSYFNEFTPKSNRYQRLVDSSLDWGQDLLRLNQFIQENQISEIKVDYFGGSVPEYYIPQAEAWHSGCGPTKGWLAVSATFFQSSKLAGPREGKWSYDWLEKFEPKAIIGGSILVYYISDQDYAQNPPRSNYEIKTFEYCPKKESNRKVGL